VQHNKLPRMQPKEHALLVL